MAESYPCPKCGAKDWKRVRVYQEIKQCKNCDYSPWLDREKGADYNDFKEWLIARLADSQAAEDAMAAADAVVKEKGADKLSILEMANVRKAARELEKAKAILAIAEATATILGQMSEGAITIHSPELGLFHQFHIGDYDLFAALKKTLGPKG